MVVTLVCRVHWGHVWNLLTCPSLPSPCGVPAEGPISQFCLYPGLSQECIIWKHNIECIGTYPWLQLVASQNNLRSSCSQFHNVELGTGLPHSQVPVLHSQCHKVYLLYMHQVAKTERCIAQEIVNSHYNQSQSQNGRQQLYYVPIGK